MKHVLTLIGKPLTPEQIARAATLADAGAPDWLAPDLACDLPLAGPLPADLEVQLRAALEGAAVDLAIQPAAGRRKQLLIADMDSTFITVECIDEMAAAFGIGEQIAEITRRAMRGELDFAQALRERVAMLAGFARTDLDAVWEDHITLMPGGRALVATMRANGAFTALVSGGFDVFTSRVRRAVGFDLDLANRLLLADDRLTGAVAEPILGADAKRETLDRLLAERGLDASRALAVGDGANDAAMIRAAGLGVAYHAKPILAEIANVRVEHGDLTTLLYIQGYRAGDIVAD